MNHGYCYNTEKLHSVTKHTHTNLCYKAVLKSIRNPRCFLKSDSTSKAEILNSFQVCFYHGRLSNLSHKAKSPYPNMANIEFSESFWISNQTKPPDQIQYQPLYMDHTSARFFQTSLISIENMSQSFSHPYKTCKAVIWLPHLHPPWCAAVP